MRVTAALRYQHLTGKSTRADLEAEMIKRGMLFEVIDWSEDQTTLPSVSADGALADDSRSRPGGAMVYRSIFSMRSNAFCRACSSSRVREPI